MSSANEMFALTKNLSQGLTKPCSGGKKAFF